MKLKTKKTKVLLSLALLIIFLFSGIFNNRFSKNIVTNNNYLEFNEKDQVQINQSGFWDLTGNPIYIDDLATGIGAHNWTWAETQPWCSGSGSWADPYVIENVTIDGQGSGNCLSIENSDAYYIIQNCSLYNSSSFSGNAGIKLDNVDNGKIINNNCSDNYDRGIYLYDSNNNTILGNTARNNEYGIYLEFSNNNTISGNSVSNNDGGIDLYYSNKNTISGNNASNNNYRGIYLGYSNNNTLLGNTANNSNYGIVLNGNNNNNTLSGNNASNNNIYGIILILSNDNTLSENTASKNDDDGIYLMFSSNNTLSSNLMNYCGISLEGSLVEMASHIIDDTNLVNNKPVYYYVNETGLGSSNFSNAGQIILINCNNSIISGITISDGYGIFLGYSNNNTISENKINNNLFGIKIDSNSKNNNIFLNNFTNNEIDAEDNGINNIWDNGVIGNYWDEYDGVDANDDGIGDTPYLISGTAGSQDNFPIWTDGDEFAPVISFGNYYILFMFITILSFIFLEKRKKE